MTKSAKKMLNAAFLVVELVVFAAFAFSSGLLYYALTDQAPPDESARQLDNNFVPFVLLFVLLVGAAVFGLAFLTHFIVWRIDKAKEKRAAAERFD